MPVRTVEYPGFTPYEIHGPERPAALLMFAPTSRPDAVRSAREYAHAATVADPSIAVAVPTAPLEGWEHGDQFRRLAGDIYNRHHEDGQSLLLGVGQVPSANIARIRDVIGMGVQGVYLLGPEIAESRQAYLKDLPPFVDFADGLLVDENRALSQRLAATRDLQVRSAQWSDVTSPLAIELNGGRRLSEPNELPPGVVWAKRAPAGAGWSDDIAALKRKEVIKLANAMAELPILGLVTDGQEITGLLGEGVPANSQLIRLELGPQYVDWQPGVKAFAATSQRQRAESKSDTAVLRPLGPLRGWEPEFAAALSPTLSNGSASNDSAPTLLIDAAEGFEVSASLVAAALLEQRPELKGRVGLAIEPQRFRTSINVKLLHRLQRLCADNDVRLLYQSGGGLDLDRAHELIAGKSNQWPDYSRRPQVQAALALPGGAKRRGGRQKRTGQFG